MENSTSLSTNESLNYSSTSGPTTLIPEYLEESHAIVLCTVLAVASVVGTIGNALVLSSIIKFENLREIPDLFIFSLSLSDLLVTALFQPFKIYRLARLQEISENMAFIKISRFLGFLSLTASITNIFGVTVERLISIQFPLKYDLLVTKKRAAASLICIWLFSLAQAAIVLKVAFFRFFTYIFLLLLIAGTVCIYIYLFLVAKRLEAAVPQNRSFQNEDRRPRTDGKHKAGKTIAIILGVALLCWLPFFIIPAVLSARGFHTTMAIFSSLQTLSICNSSINPYIYCARSRRFYMAFLKLLGLRKCMRVGAFIEKPMKIEPVSRPGGVVNQLEEPQNNIGDVAV